MRGSVFTVDTLTVDSRVAFRLRDESSSGGEAYARDKTPQQDFALKMQGGLCVRGGGVCTGHYSTCSTYVAKE